METIDIVFNTITTIWSVLKWTWWIGVVVFLFALKQKWKAYPLEAIIIEKRGNNLIKTNDRCGKFIDPFDHLVKYKLQKAKDTIPVLNFEWILVNAFKPTNFFEKFVNLLRGDIGTVFLYRYGTKQYKPINIKENKNGKMSYQEILGDDGKPIIINVYQPFDPRHKLGALDFEVVDWDNMNFMIQEQRASILRRQKQGEWLKQTLIPLIIVAACVIIGIIILKFSSDAGINLKSGSPSQSVQEKPAEAPKIPVIGDLIPGT
jgi:hypothetical protein